MKFAKATWFDRKSGVAQGRDLQFHFMENGTRRPGYFRYARKRNCRSLPYAALQSG
jgi:hypothetical protein